MALTDNLISYYKLDSTWWADSVWSNTMTEANTSYVSGKIGNWCSFNGSTSQMRNGNITLPAGNSPYSINFWVKLNAEISSWVWALSFFWPDGTDQDTEYYLEYQYNWWTRRINYQHYYNWPETYHTLPYNVTLWTSNWNMFTMTYSGSVMKLYLNGTEVASGWWGWTYWFSSPYSYQKWLTIWSQYVLSTYGNRSNAIIDEVGIWSRALSASEVTELYNAGAWLQYPFTAGVLTAFFMFFMQ